MLSLKSVHGPFISTDTDRICSDRIRTNRYFPAPTPVNKSNFNIKSIINKKLILDRD